MAATKEIKRRISSIKNTKKITKAMEMVSASKMKRSVNATLSSRAYASQAWKVLETLQKHRGEENHYLLKARPENEILVVLVTSNRGLCGSYNSQILRKTLQFIKDHKSSNLSFIAVGKMGEIALRRLGQNIVASFDQLPDSPSYLNTLPIGKLIFDDFYPVSKNAENDLENMENVVGNYDAVYVCYTDYVSALRQDPQIGKLLPIGTNKPAEASDQMNQTLHDSVEQSDEESVNFLFEPDYNLLIPPMIEKITHMRIYQMIIESSASEHSARMLAMQNAREAAGEIIDDLTLSFNKARQASITQEISEISAGTMVS